MFGFIIAVRAVLLAILYCMVGVVRDPLDLVCMYME